MIPLMKNTFINEYETKKAICDFIMNSDKLSMGVKCSEFEKQFAAKQKMNDAILLNSGGSANLCMLQALKNLGRIKSGDKVGFSALTWSTNVMPIIQMDLEAVPVDCSPETLNVMSETLERAIVKEGLKCFFSTNVLGFAGDLAQIKAVCEKHNVIYIEDNCEALGTELVDGDYTGAYGLASSFSFFVAHHMSTIEGGMICTNDEELAEMIRIVRANGWDRNLSAAQQIKWRKKYEIKSEFRSKYTFYELGYNLRPTEITGVLGLEQMKYLDENIRVREQNFHRIHEVMKNNEDLVPFELDHISKISSFALPVLCKSKDLMEKYLTQFSGAGIEIRPMIAGNIQDQPFYKKYIHKEYDLSGTAFIDQNGFYCGNYPELTEVDLQVITSCLTKY